MVVIPLLADSDASSGLAALLTGDELRRANRFVFDRDRRRFIVARARVRQLLALRLGARPEAVELEYGACGKPALAGHFASSGLRFNVSHCDDLAVCALVFGREVGIDIEGVRVMPDADALATRVFSRREQAAYLALQPHDRPAGFFNCWTRKEAFIKALGDGLTHPLDRFDVSLAPEEPARILRVGETPGDRCGWRMQSFVPAPGFVAAIVTGELRSSASRVTLAAAV